MTLRLLLGPARSGKAGIVVARFGEALGEGAEPVLVAPNAPAAIALERELCERAGAVIGGLVTTFDGLADTLLAQTGGALDAPPDGVRSVLLRRLGEAESTPGASRGGSTRSPGFAAALGRFIWECQEAGVSPSALRQSVAALNGQAVEARDVAELYAAWVERLSAAGLMDRPARLGEAVRRVASRLDAWPFGPLLAYGFDDLTATQLALVEAVAQRGEALVALPWEAARPAFAAVDGVVERLGARGAEIVELPPAEDGRPAALRHLERAVFAERAHDPPAEPDGSVRMLEAAGAQLEAETIAATAADLLRHGLVADDVLVVVPSPEAALSELEAAFRALDVPVVFDARLPLARTPLGHALVALLRFAWGDGTREQLFAWLRSPASGLARARVDNWEGRIRGQGRRRGDDAYALLVELAGQPLAVVERLRADDPLSGARALLEVLPRLAFGLSAGVREDDARARQVRAWAAAARALDELGRLDPPPSGQETLAALEATTVRVGSDRASGRVRVVSYNRARTISAEVVIAAGLEEGRMPGRERPDALASDELRSALATRGSALERRERAAVDRYRFYVALTRARRQVVLVRRASTEEGEPLAASPFWDEVVRALGGAAPTVERRGLADLTYPLERAPSERERLRAIAALCSTDSLGARRLAAAGPEGWTRRIDRAQHARSRRTSIADTALLARLRARRSFSVSELEMFLDCSQRWFVEILLGPREIDGVVDHRRRGSAAHAALQRLFVRLPAALGHDTLEPGDLARAEEVLDDAIGETVAAVRLPQGSVEMQELSHRMARDLRAFLRSELRYRWQFSPDTYEVGFGGEGGPRLVLDVDGEPVGLRGRIDRVDRDPHASRAIVQDYKYSRNASGARDIVRRDSLLQLPLYVDAVRQLLGLEAVAGVYRAIGAGGRARGMALEGEGVDGLDASDYLEREEFEQVIATARARATGAVSRIHRGDVRHDPLGGSCPAWCEAFAVCRVRWRV